MEKRLEENLSCRGKGARDTSYSAGPKVKVPDSGSEECEGESDVEHSISAEGERVLPGLECLGCVKFHETTHCEDERSEGGGCSGRESVDFIPSHSIEEFQSSSRSLFMGGARVARRQNCGPCMNGAQ